MPNNLDIKGIQSDETVGSRRLKPRGKRRKPWVIESRLRRAVTPGLAFMLRLKDWSVYNRYTTKARRDQAYAALVKKPIATWGWEFRKRDD